MPQIFEKFTILAIGQGSTDSSASELETEQLYFAFGSVGRSERQLSCCCLRAALISAITLGLSTSKPSIVHQNLTQDGDRAGCLKAGQHLMLIENPVGLPQPYSVLIRYKNKQSVGGYLPYCDAQISTSMLTGRGSFYSGKAA